MFRHLNKLLITGMFILFACGPGDMASKVQAATLPEIHELANDVTLSLGIGPRDFCSATVIDKDKNLVATANHCAEIARTVVYFIDWTDDKNKKKVKYEYYVPLVVTNHKMKENGEVYSTTRCEALVLGVDMTHDQALLKVDDRCHFNNAVKLARAVVNYGDKAYTMGNPFMAYNVVATAEVTQPQAYFDEIGDFPVILFQGQLAPGSSGGALVNEKGEYIGTTNWGVGMMAMASPVEHLINLMKRLHV